MNYYVVRIYRGESESEIVGLVEDVTNNTRTAFRDRDELWSALVQEGKTPRQNKRARSAAATKKSG